MNERITPHSLEAEQSTLGAMMLERSAIARAVETLQASDFYREAHAKIFDAIVAIFNRGEEADYMNVVIELQARGQIDQLNGAGNGVAYVEAVWLSCPSAANIDAYIAPVALASAKRQVLKISQQIANDVYASDKPADEIISDYQSKLLDLGARHVRGGFVQVGEVIADECAKIIDRVENPNTAPGLMIGFSDVDEMTNGLKPGQLVIIGARPAAGKTSCALKIASHVAMRYRENVAVFSMEMGRDELVQRMQCTEARVNTKDLERAKLTDEEWERLDASSTRLKRAPLHIDDSPYINIGQMRSRCLSLAAKHGALGLIVVDYLQLMSSPSKSENRVQAISEISRGLKQLARELKAPVIALSQLSRKVEERENKRPMLSDLRESGCVAGDSLIYLPDEGVYRRIDELIGRTGFNVLALNTKTWKLEPRSVTNSFATGIKPVHEMKTRSGRIIRATANHKFLTIQGWKRLDQLAIGERIATPRTLVGPAEKTMKDDELGLLGLLIGDGCTLAKQPVHFTTVDADVAEIVAGLAKSLFGDTVKPRINHERTWIQVYLAATQHLTHLVRNPVAKWLDAMGVFNLRSYEKFVPERVFRQNNAAVACFLRHLWATDGCIWVGSTKATRVYYATSSLRLARDVQSLLLRLSINATLRACPQGSKGRDQYHVTVSGKVETERFINIVGAVGERKNHSLDQLRSSFDEHGHNTNRDVIPCDAWREIAVPAMAKIGMTSRQMQSELGNAYCGTSLYKNSLGRERAERLAGIVKSEELAALASSDVYWDAIISITASGEEPVYDLTVEGLHNFVVNDIVAHNSIEQDADIVAFLYRPSVYENDKNNESTHNDAQEETEFIVGKHRGGRVGTVRLGFQPAYARFVDLAWSER